MTPPPYFDFNKHNSGGNVISNLCFKMSGMSLTIFYRNRQDCILTTQLYWSSSIINNVKVTFLLDVDACTLFFSSSCSIWRLLEFLRKILENCFLEIKTAWVVGRLSNESLLKIEGPTLYIVGWEPEGGYRCSTMFCWVALMPFWLWTDDISCITYLLFLWWQENVTHVNSICYQKIHLSNVSTSNLW